MSIAFKVPAEIQKRDLTSRREMKFQFLMYADETEYYLAYLIDFEERVENQGIKVIRSRTPRLPMIQ